MSYLRTAMKIVALSMMTAWISLKKDERNLIVFSWDTLGGRKQFKG